MSEDAKVEALRECPTHYCVVCAARWRKHDDGTWSVLTPCGPCCDNVPMDQAPIATLSADGRVAGPDAQKVKDEWDRQQRQALIARYRGLQCSLCDEPFEKHWDDWTCPHRVAPRFKFPADNTRPAPADNALADEWRKDCESCCGEGTIERGDMPLHHLHSEAPEYAVQSCDDCNGKGWCWTDELVPLRNCPVGLFLSGNTLCLKTEYGNNEGRIDAFIVSSGEFFWGSAPQTIPNQRDQLVKPVELDRILAALRQPEDDGRGLLQEALEFIADAPDPGAQEERSATFYRVHAAFLKQVAAKALGRQTVSQEALDWAEEWANSEEGRQALSARDTYLKGPRT